MKRKVLCIASKYKRLYEILKNPVKLHFAGFFKKNL